MHFPLESKTNRAMNNEMLLKACKTISSKVVVYHTKLFIIMVEVSACNCQQPLGYTAFEERYIGINSVLVRIRLI